MITHEKFLEVTEKIRAEERRRQDEITADIRAKFEEQLRDQSEKLQRANVERAELEARHQQHIQAATKAAEDAATLKGVEELQRMRVVLDKENQEKLAAVTEDAAKRLEDAQKKLAEFEAQQGQTERVIDVLDDLQTAFGDSQ